MKSGRYLFVVLLALLCCFPAQGFQTSAPIKLPAATHKTAAQASQDELAIHRTAAETYQLSGDLDHARVENRLIVSIALRRLASVAIRDGQSKRGSELLQESIAAGDSVDARTALAMLYTQSGDPEEGIRQAKAAVSLDADSGEAQETLGKLLYIKGDYAEALPTLERVLTLTPNFDAAYALGVSYLQLKQVDRAKLLFEELLEGVGNKAALHVMLGNAFQQANYPVDAERELRKAIEVDSKVPRAHFYLGYLILQEGGSERLAEAGKEFELEMISSPKDPYSNFFAGVVATSEGDHAKAIRYLGEATRLDPNMGTAYLFLGQSQAEMGDNTSAEKSLRRSIQLTPDASKNSFEIRRAHFLLGRLLIKLGRKDEGEKELAAARVIQGQMIESAREEIRKILGQVATPTTGAKSSDPLTAKVAAPASSPSTPRPAVLRTTRDQIAEIVAQAYHNLAVIDAQNGQIDESLAHFAAAARWKPDFPGLDRNWGIVSFKANQFDKAVEPLSRQLKAHPDDALVRRMLGVSYYFTKNPNQAIDTLKPIELKIASDPELAYFYGISLVQLQRHPEAAVVFGHIADQNPSSAQAHFYAGQGFVLTGGYERAVKEFRQAAAIDPRMATAHYNAGQTLIRMNKLDEAEKEFRQELQLYPADESSKYYVAYTLLERKTGTDEALKLLREAIASKYDYADARYQLGKALIEKGDINEAIDQLETAANLDPKKDYIHYQLNIAYRKASRIEDADRELKLYRELKAENRSEKPAGMGSKKDVP